MTVDSCKLSMTGRYARQENHQIEKY